MAREDYLVVEKFKDVVVNHLEDVLIALPALIPQNKDDEILFKEGMKKISELVYHLKHADNIREVGRYIDVDRVINDFDMDTVTILNSKINQLARNSMAKLDEMIEEISSEDR